MHDGRASSHFLCRLLQVRHPVLTFALLARVRLGLLGRVTVIEEGVEERGPGVVLAVAFDSGDVDRDVEVVLPSFAAMMMGKYACR